MIDIYIYNVKEIISERKKQLLFSVLSTAERSKIKRLKRAKDRKNALLSRYLLRNIIGELIGSKPKELIINKTKYDRPVLVNPDNQDWDFNVSHSGDWIVIGVSNNGGIGVDIEEIRPINMNIAKDCFTDKEIVFLNRYEKKKLENFYKLWTLKESFVKAIGQGLSCPLKNFYFEFKGNKIIHKIKNRKSNWQFKMYNIELNY